MHSDRREVPNWKGRFATVTRHVVATAIVAAMLFTVRDQSVAVRIAFTIAAGSIGLIICLAEVKDLRRIFNLSLGFFGGAALGILFSPMGAIDGKNAGFVTVIIFAAIGLFIGLFANENSAPSRSSTWHNGG